MVQMREKILCWPQTQFKETDNVFWCFLKYWDTVETVRVCGKQYREFIGYVFNLFMFL